MAEFGFLGVRVMTWMHTPRRKGAISKAGDLDLRLNLLRPLRTNWLIVGISTNVFALLPGYGETERGYYQNCFVLQLVFELFSSI
jgi:hypothetical protein